jgi:hypothetical protein
VRHDRRPPRRGVGLGGRNRCAFKGGEVATQAEPRSPADSGGGRDQGRLRACRRAWPQWRCRARPRCGDGEECGGWRPAWGRRGPACRRGQKWPAEAGGTLPILPMGNGKEGSRWRED